FHVTGVQTCALPISWKKSGKPLKKNHYAMRTSLNEIEQIEKYLLGGLKSEDRLLFQAELLLNPQKAENVYWQQKTYQLIQAYGRSEERRVGKECRAG